MAHIAYRLDEKTELELNINHAENRLKALLNQIGKGDRYVDLVYAMDKNRRFLSHIYLRRVENAFDSISQGETVESLIEAFQKVVMT
jgi:hypothetical protein